jgi:hypothetical protein
MLLDAIEFGFLGQVAIHDEVIWTIGRYACDNTCAFVLLDGIHGDNVNLTELRKRCMDLSTDNILARNSSDFDDLAPLLELRLKGHVARGASSDEQELRR